MRVARQKQPRRNRQLAHRTAVRAKYARLLKAGLAMTAAEPANGCSHEWVLEGQTLGGNIFSCSKCKVVKFG